MSKRVDAGDISRWVVAGVSLAAVALSCIVSTDEIVKAGPGDVEAGQNTPVYAYLPLILVPQISATPEPPSTKGPTATKTETATPGVTDTPVPPLTDTATVVPPSPQPEP